jgi:uroporphyrinogen-III synthase
MEKLVSSLEDFLSTRYPLFTTRFPMSDLTLTGRTIAIPESRELDVFASMMERRGAAVIRCPLVTILDAPDPAPVLEWIRQFNSGAFDDLILLTGEGLRRLLSCIDKHEPALRADFLAMLARVRKIARGPKPAKVLRELGLKPDISAPIATTQGVIDALQGESLKDRRVAVQRYGTEPNTALESFLSAAGARVVTVAPYVYADEATNSAVLDLLNRMAAGEVDVIAFTSSPQVERLFAVGSPELVKKALERTEVAAVGPVVAATLAKHDIRAKLMPQDSYFMKPLTTLIEQAMQERSG